MPDDQQKGFSLYNYDRHPTVEIDRGEYRKIRDAKAGLGEIVRSETKFDDMMENYVELEQSILGFSLRHLAFSLYSHLDIQIMREQISRRLLNMLATVRLYQDGLKGHSRRILTTSDSKAMLGILKDGSHQPMEYRIVYALRNFSQHVDPALTSIAISKGWDMLRNEEDERIKKDRAYHIVIPKIDCVRLSKERDIPSDVKAALEKMGPAADVMDHVRKCIEHLGEINSTFRKLAKPRADIWESILRQAMQRFVGAQPAGEKPPTVVFAGPTEIEKGSEERVEIFEEFFEYWKYLVRKNRSQVNFSRRYVQWAPESGKKKK
ncbi:MAG: hypothetical protein AMXMBFR74_05310 [Parvibaculum sp.]|uniref:hypothetical protein n=1 Tax=Parvibaculum sp. TaxID=2024848 RepID=UPI0035B98FC7